MPNNKSAGAQQSLPRRDFLKSGAAAATAFTILSSGAYGKPRRISKNDRVNVAVIGAGGMGRANLQALSSQNIVALCDVDWNYVDSRFGEIPAQLEQAKTRLGQATDDAARQRVQAQVDGWLALQPQLPRARRFDDYRQMHARSLEDPEGFWAEQAEAIDWFHPWHAVLDVDFKRVDFAWFSGGRLNASYNCVDRHVEAGNGDRVAIHWEGEPIGDSRTITYADLLAEVSRAANALTELGLTAGDRVAIYMPMVPEAIVAMLACARLGVLHSVVFAGFSATALRARVEDAEAKLVITTDGQYRRGKAVFDQWCAACHAPGPRHPGTQALDALYKGSKPGALEQRTDLVPKITETFVRKGVSVMAPYRKTEISDADLAALAAYLAPKTP